MTPSTPGSRLNPEQRRRDLARMASDQFDIVIVGGGVTGCGVALDAAARGCSVALVEQRDYGSGTSSRSSKLLHGGLRYLEQRNFTLVREALSERDLMLERLAPHLATPVSFLYPLRHRLWERIYVGAGVLLYDMLASRGHKPLPRHRHLSRRRALALAPALAPSSLVGGLLYWDASTDDARHTLTLARTAAGLGAALASSTRVTAFTRDERGKLDGVIAHELENGEQIHIRGRRVINATGVWSDDIQRMAGSRGLEVTASKGIHLVVARQRIPSDTGLILRTEKSVLFVVPWGEHWIVGTTDTPWRLGRAHPAASRSDIDYLLHELNGVLADPVQPGDVVGVFAGLRPLLSGESEETSRLSREHRVIESESGLITVAGGKYTTYRVMARDAVDVALGPEGPGSNSDRVPLIGAEGFARTWARRDQLGLPTPERLLRRYGSLALELLESIRADPHLAEPVVDDAPYLKAEVAYAVTHEGALHLDDVLTRRTRLSIETRDRGLEAAATVSEIMQRHLGWDQATTQREISHYAARVEAEIHSQEQPDDHTADAARMGAPDVRTGGSE